MITNPEVFKAYDLRGVYGIDFDEELAYKLGLAFAALISQENGGRPIKIVAASDARLSSPILKENLMRGLTEGGAEVVDIGLASTPTFYFAVAHYGYDGGITVSASHNPKEYNGFKLVRSKAVPLGKETGLDKLKNDVLSGDVQPVAQPGKITMQTGVVADQVTHDLALADSSQIKPFKIVVDTANAMGAVYFEELFKHLPCEIIKMNWELDGNFPAHQADPFKPENVAALRARVLDERADLGITTDGDADRIFFVTETGEAVEAGITRAILARLFLADKPGAKIGYDIRPGKITPEIITAVGGVPVITRVGHTLIKAQMLQEDIYFAGESSGHFFLNMDEGCYEVPMVVVLKILQDLSLSQQAFSVYIKPYKKYWHAGEINARVADPAAKIAAIKQAYGNGRLSEIDGLSVEYDDFWFNVRASNTEPLLRLNLEAKTKEMMEAKRDEIVDLIKA